MANNAPERPNRTVNDFNDISDLEKALQAMGLHSSQRVSPDLEDQRASELLTKFTCGGGDYEEEDDNDDVYDEEGRITSPSPVRPKLDPSLDWVLENYDESITEPQTIEEELKRLWALKSYMVLDSERQESFERITRLASRLFRCPMALISLVDIGRQWFMSNRGLGEVRETKRKYAFCAHAIMSKEDCLIVPDATKDSRFQDNPLVTGPPDIRFYAGAPLISPEGYKLGTLCILDTQSRPEGLTKEEKQNLLELSALAVQSLVHHRRTKEKSTKDPGQILAYTAGDLPPLLPGGEQMSLSELMEAEFLTESHPPITMPPSPAWHLESTPSTSTTDYQASCFPREDDGPPDQKRRRPEDLAEVEIARELGKLPVKEREIVYEELHGISSNPSEVETEDFVKAKIEALKEALSKIPNARKLDWERASFYNPTFLSNDTFLLLFLRTEGYNAEEAAQRLCLHFRKKAKLWGPEKLSKRITLEDLTEADIRCLRDTGLRFTPYSDSVRRRLLILPTRWVADSWENAARAFWYLIMSWCLDHPDEQAAGAVSINNNYGIKLEDCTRMISLLRKTMDFNEALPTNVKASHVMIENPILRAPLQGLARMFSNKVYMRMLFHSGSTMEMGYTLMTYGIRLDPQTLSNEISFQEDQMDEYFERQKLREVELKAEAQLLLSQKGRVLYPSEKDVLIGKGRHCYDYPGNHLMRSTVQEFLVQYQEGGDRVWKQALCMNVVDLMEENGTRFLERKDDCWVVAEKQVSVKKISQFFRELIRKNARSHA